MSRDAIVKAGMPAERAALALIECGSLLLPRNGMAGYQKLINSGFAVLNTRNILHPTKRLLDYAASNWAFTDIAH